MRRLALVSFFGLCALWTACHVVADIRRGWWDLAAVWAVATLVAVVSVIYQWTIPVKNADSSRREQRGK